MASTARDSISWSLKWEISLTLQYLLTLRDNGHQISAESVSTFPKQGNF